MNKYEDIINLPHHVSATRKSMTLYNRASQFVPFSVLTGYVAGIKEATRLTDRKMKLDEDSKKSNKKNLFQ